MATDVPRCVRCEYVWRDPCDPSEPDTNHCAPMLETVGPLRLLTKEQRDRLYALIDARVVCPCFTPTSRSADR